MSGISSYSIIFLQGVFLQFSKQCLPFFSESSAIVPISTSYLRNLLRKFLNTLHPSGQQM